MQVKRGLAFALEVPLRVLFVGKVVAGLRTCRAGSEGMVMVRAEGGKRARDSSLRWRGICMMKG